MKLKHTLFIALASVLFAFPSTAQVEVLPDIVKEMIPGREKPIPVSFSGITGEAAEVIMFDLTIQGFSFTSAEQAQYLISGSASGNLTGRAQDRINKSFLVNKSYSGAPLRHLAHTFVDDFLAALGRKGLGKTKIAFKRDSGVNSEIHVADFDGFGAKSVTLDNNLVISPSWVPGRMALYYTSYHINNAPYIYSHDLISGRRTDIAKHPGSNLSPAVSPDGQRVAMILSLGGAVDLYVGDANGKNLKRLTRSKEDESSPTWSPDGKWICFAGKKDERRALWKIPATGGEAVRITTTGAPNPSEPDWSPDGKWIAFTSQVRAGFSIYVVRAEGGAAIQLAAGEDPSWAPNSRTVIYAVRGQNNRRLSMLDVPTKQTKTITRISGNHSQPSWAK
jgi:TolB protein